MPEHCIAPETRKTEIFKGKFYALFFICRKIMYFDLIFVKIFLNFDKKMFSTTLIYTFNQNLYFFKGRIRDISVPNETNGKNFDN